MLIMQGVPLSTRKPTGGCPTGIAPFLQLPHFNETVVKKILRKVKQKLTSRNLFISSENMTTAFFHFTHLN